MNTRIKAAGGRKGKKMVTHSEGETVHNDVPTISRSASSNRSKLFRRPSRYCLTTKQKPVLIVAHVKKDQGRTTCVSRPVMLHAVYAHFIPLMSLLPSIVRYQSLQALRATALFLDRYCQPLPIPQTESCASKSRYPRNPRSGAALLRAVARELDAETGRHFEAFSCPKPTTRRRS